MRQVPRYLLIGRGRVASHMKYYFALSGAVFTTWDRSQSIDQLTEKAATATHILLLISDHAIESFVENHLATTNALLIHFSGSLVSARVHGAHPLMTFSHHLYSLEEYHKIPFIIDETAPTFSELLPGFKNPHVYLPTEKKAKYHALCVLAGNFSCLLWQKLFKAFEEDLQIPATMAFPYLKQQSENLMSNADSALTGPLIRGDAATITKNLLALTDDPIQAIYHSFVTYYAATKKSV